MKKVFAVALAMTVAVGMLAGCGSNDSAQGGAADGTITVVSREDGIRHKRRIYRAVRH